MLILVSNFSAPWGRRRVDRKDSEAIVSKTYNRMRLACSREVKSKRGPKPWPDFDTNCSRVGGPCHSAFKGVLLFNILHKPCAGPTSSEWWVDKNSSWPKGTASFIGE